MLLIYVLLCVRSFIKARKTAGSRRTVVVRWRLAAAECCEWVRCRDGRARQQRCASAGRRGSAKEKADLKKAMPEIWKLVRPRRWLLALGLAAGGDQSCGRADAAASPKPFVDQVMHEASRRAADAAGGGGVSGDAYPGGHIVFEHAIAVKGGAADDRRPAPAGAAACWAAFGQLL